jgi:hypothetical protein
MPTLPDQIQTPYAPITKLPEIVNPIETSKKQRVLSGNGRSIVVDIRRAD